MNQEQYSPYLEEIEIAKSNPNGWVYRISKSYANVAHVPPEAIVGAWKVDKNGKIIGDFIENKNFVSEK